MARPRIFVSSTYYDLKHLRSSLEVFIESLGYEPILSEKGDIAYLPDVPLDESCYREVHNADVYVLIVGGRYGSEKSGQAKAAKAFFERYDSITKMEYKSAIAQDIPIYVLIERSVYGDYENFLRNRSNQDFNYAHVDSVNIFLLVEEILAQQRNNPIYQFDRYSDIEGWLREQWSGLFRELLARASSQRQLASLSAQVQQLAEFNQTMKRYLEEVMVKVAPQESARLIRDESKRLEGAKRQAVAKQNPLIEYLAVLTRLQPETLVQLAIEHGSLDKFIDAVIQKAGPNVRTEEIETIKSSGHARRDFLMVRVSLASQETSQASKLEPGEEPSPAAKQQVITRRRKGAKPKDHRDST